MRSSSNSKVLVRWILSWHWGGIVFASGVLYVALRWGVPLMVGEGPMRAEIRPVGELMAMAGAICLGALAPVSWVRRRKEQRLLDDLKDIDGLRQLSWWELEMLVRAIYERNGFKARRIGGDGADGGVDVRLTRRGEVVLVQCKQWRARQVPVSVVRELLGAITAEGAQRGVVVTCGTFTGDAWGFALANGIELVDGMRLVDMARRVSRVKRGAGAADPGPQEVGLRCPKCGGLMVQRRARASGGDGVFLGCTRFPVCKGTRPLNGR